MGSMILCTNRGWGSTGGSVEGQKRVCASVTASRRGHDLGALHNEQQMQKRKAEEKAAVGSGTRKRDID